MRFLNVLLGILVYFVLINLFTWSILSALNIPYCIIEDEHVINKIVSIVDSISKSINSIDLEDDLNQIFWDYYGLNDNEINLIKKALK